MAARRVFATLVFIAGYITARYSLFSRTIDLSVFAWEHGVVGRTIKGFLILSLFFFLFCVSIERVAVRSATGVCLVWRFAARCTIPDTGVDRQQRTEGLGTRTAAPPRELLGVSGGVNGLV